MPDEAFSAVQNSPRFDSLTAERAAAELFGISCRAELLPGERDQNFLLSSDRGEFFVLKFANALDGAAVVDLQQSALRHLESRVDFVPRVIRTSSGDSVGSIETPEGEPVQVWCCSFLNGRTLASLPHHSDVLLRSIGRAAAELSLALSDFTHPALNRTFVWDLSCGVATARELVGDVADARVREQIVAILDAVEAVSLPRFAQLPRSPVHGDLNDHNILVRHEWAAGERLDTVAGVIDYGDLMLSYRIAELAVALAYVMLDKGDPLLAAREVVSAFHTRSPLSDIEAESVFGLALLRMCLSICIGEQQRRRNPTNLYLGISDAPMRAAIERLARVPLRFANAVMRSACGMEPSPASPEVRRWLKNNTSSIAPILGKKIDPGSCIVLDLSVSSPLVSGDATLNEEPEFTRRVFGEMEKAGVALSVGRYDEPRLLYTAPFFAGEAGSPSTRRTIHIGLDLFAEAGTAIHAPLDGTVVGLADNAVLQDYGPVVILEHRPSDGPTFFSLYGHLQRESWSRLEVGDVIKSGEAFVHMGEPDENVGWTPHLHLQLMTDLLDTGTDFPGVGQACFRDVWRSVCPDPNLLALVPDEVFPVERNSPDDLLAARKQHTGPSVRLAHRSPLHAARGWKQFIYSADGRKYLDAFNNVPHVGHAHPRVVSAAAEQLAVLNTNTRYLTSQLGKFSERLCGLFPAPLDVCFLVNSGSEANELAVRLARTFTGRRHFVVLDHAYHGNTSTAIDLSPYKHNGPGGDGAPDWVHVAQQPDDYRGPYKRSNADAGILYAADVAEMLRVLHGSGREVAALLAESCPSVGGQLLPPLGYFAEVQRLLREVGALFIADEVQTGFGRLGSHMWAFEAQQVVPDIVVLGKPMGNGYPLGAVVTTRAIADAFNNGMEYFSTFGGSTVSCAVGHAVLDVLRDEGLMQRAMETGKVLSDRLYPLLDRFELVGDVRGSGLFWGVELVKDRDTLEPASSEASFIVERMREESVLIGSDGPFHNVLKIRPPMAFGTDDAHRLVDCLESVMEDLALSE